MINKMNSLEQKEKDFKDFEKVVRPVIEYLNNLDHPHFTIIITPTNAELLEGVKSTGQILDYVKD